MIHLLNKKGFRLLTFAVGVTGTGFYYANRNKDAKTMVSLSVPPWFQEHLCSPQFSPLPGYCSLNFSRFGSNSLPSSVPDKVPENGNGVNFSRIGSNSLPSSVPDKVPENGDGGKCCSGCIGRYTIAKAASMVGPAVVHLSVNQGMGGGMTLGKSVGSGTIIDSDGTILTCAHVVADFQFRGAVSKGKVDVTLQDGRTFEGTVMNADFRSDIATVKIKSKTPLPSAKLGSSCKLIPGEPVLSLGCPLSLQNTVTAGIVSCVDRKSSDMGLGGLRREFLQTDCPINEGNSGGPLVDLDGEVVGVNTMKVLAANGLGFAVPIDAVSKILEQFKKHGRVVRPWLGLKMIDLNEMIVAQLKERDIAFPDVDKGVLIPMVTPDSPATRAGFHAGDVVIQFDGKPVGSIKEIVDIMGDKIGKPMKVVVMRANNRVVTLTVVPEEGYPDM